MSSQCRAQVKADRNPPDGANVTVDHLGSDNNQTHPVSLLAEGSDYFSLPVRDSIANWRRQVSFPIPAQEEVPGAGRHLLSSAAPETETTNRVTEQASATGLDSQIDPTVAVLETEVQTPDTVIESQPPSAPLTRITGPSFIEDRHTGSLHENFPELYARLESIEKAQAADESTPTEVTTPRDMTTTRIKGCVVAVGKAITQTWSFSQRVRSKETRAQARQNTPTGGLRGENGDLPPRAITREIDPHEPVTARWFL